MDDGGLVNHSYDYRPNWTPLSPITIINLAVTGFSVMQLTLNPMEVSYKTFTWIFRGTKRLVSVNICSVEGNSADTFVSKVPPGIFVIKVR